MTLPQIDALLKIRQGNLISAKTVIRMSTNSDRVARAELELDRLKESIADLKRQRSELVAGAK